MTRKLEEQPLYIVSVMPDLLPALEYVAHHQAEVDAKESIYGNFSEKFERIQNLYTERRDGFDDAGALIQNCATCEEQPDLLPRINSISCRRIEAMYQPKSLTSSARTSLSELIAHVEQDALAAT